jgi:hypothetical protein
MLRGREPQVVRCTKVSVRSLKAYRMTHLYVGWARGLFWSQLVWEGVEGVVEGFFRGVMRGSPAPVL